MKTTKITMLLLVVFAAIGTSFAQNGKSTMQLLMATEWKAELVNDNMKFFIKLSESKMCDDLVSEGKSNPKESDYYLSDVITEKFEQEKVGKIKDGKYIINKGIYNIKVYEIIKLTEKELILQPVKDPNEKVFGRPSPTVFKPVVR